VFAQKDGEDHDRHEEQRGPGGDGGPVFAARADDGGDEGWRGLGGAGGQQGDKGIFVPSEDQAEDRGRGDAGGGLWQHDLVEGLEPRVTVDQGRFLILHRDFVDEAFQQPDGQ
jgi:hypothetical protein